MSSPREDSPLADGGIDTVAVAKDSHLFFVCCCNATIFCRCNDANAPPSAATRAKLIQGFARLAPSHQRLQELATDPGWGGRHGMIRGRVAQPISRQTFLRGRS